jgi:ATP-dependent NAD(P)H-hydrate dehydratase
MDKWLPRLHALVIGPGLGRDKTILSNVEQLIGILRKQEKPIPIVIDADGLYLITEKPDLINNYENCILTPNGVEFERLYEKVTGVKAEEQKKEKDKKQLAQKLAEALRVNILMKGHLDTIASPHNQDPIQCGIDGSPRRCGGQGDLLAGALVASYYWAIKNREKIEYQASISEKSPRSPDQINPFSKLMPAQVAAYAASTLIRTSSQTVFNKLGRSMISADILKEVGPTFNKLFEK